MNPYLSGSQLYGDDFTPDQIEDWFRDEANGYYSLADRNKPERYSYNALNWYHGYSHLPSARFFHNVLGMGSAFGGELSAVLDRSGSITILEPASGFHNKRFQYVVPTPTGLMPFADASFDLMVSFGVLHHIANVSTVFREMVRCLTSGGYILLREPVVSMGNWNHPRPGLTKRERGIPPAHLARLIEDTGLRVIRQARCCFSLSRHLRYLGKGLPFDRRWSVAFDSAVCKLPWPSTYHATHWWQKFRATSAFYVLHKP
ncbi:MAG: class I SAM-dependent methyltransferase [Terriglobales bacterium]